MKPVRGKIDMFQRLQRGEFGNHLRSWVGLQTWRNIPKEEKPDVISIRHLRSEAPFFPNLKSYDAIEKALKDIDHLGYMWSECVFCEMAPDDACTFQGHYQNKDKRILEYSVTPGITLREASKDFLYAENYAAKFIIEDLLDPADAEWLETLLERYPGHVIEFSNFRYPLGPERRRMIIWEVRNY